MATVVCVCFFCLARSASLACFLLSGPRSLSLERAWGLLARCPPTSPIGFQVSDRRIAGCLAAQVVRLSPGALASLPAALFLYVVEDPEAASFSLDSGSLSLETALPN